MQAHHANLPFPSFTRRMTIELAKHIVMILNAFPPNSGLSKTYSPHTIMTVNTLDWNKRCKLHFGAYAQVHEDRNVTNMLEERTQGAICPGTIGNIQGTYHFFSLWSGKNNYLQTIHKSTHSHNFHETFGGNRSSQKIEQRPNL